MGIGIFFWSAASFAGGLVWTFPLFLVTRAMVGLGEAAYAPAAQSMISGAFLQERRAFAQAIFASGRLLGGALGGVLSGPVRVPFSSIYVLFVCAFSGLLTLLVLVG